MERPCNKQGIVVSAILTHPTGDPGESVSRSCFDPVLPFFPTGPVLSRAATAYCSFAYVQLT